MIIFLFQDVQLREREGVLRKFPLKIVRFSNALAETIEEENCAAITISPTTLNIMTLSVAIKYKTFEDAILRVATKPNKLSVVKLSILMLSVIMLSAIMLSVDMLSIFMASELC